MAALSVGLRTVFGLQPSSLNQRIGDKCTVLTGDVNSGRRRRRKRRSPVSHLSLHVSPSTSSSLFPNPNLPPSLPQTFFCPCRLPSVFVGLIRFSTFTAAETKQEEVVPSVSSSLFQFSLFLLLPPLFLGLLSAAGLIKGCHKCLMFSHKVPAAPRGPQSCWQAGKRQLHLQANGEPQISGWWRCRETREDLFL